MGKYIISVTAASILYAMVRSLSIKKSGSEALVQLIGGLFLAFAVISPIVNIDLDALWDFPWAFTVEAEAAAASGEAATRSQMETIIKDKCESYILDKALACGAELEVEVMLTDDSIPVPSAVSMSGNISPYAKSILQDWLQTTMGIPKENQLWTG